MQLKLDSALDKFTFLTFNFIGSPWGTLTLTVRVLTSSDMMKVRWWEGDAGISIYGSSRQRALHPFIQFQFKYYLKKSNLTVESCSYTVLAHTRSPLTPSPITNPTVCVLEHWPMHVVMKNLLERLIPSYLKVMNFYRAHDKASPTRMYDLTSKPNKWI